MKHPQYDDAVAFDTILEYIGRVEHPQHDLPIMTFGDRVPKQWVLLYHIGLFQKIAGDNLRNGG